MLKVDVSAAARPPTTEEIAAWAHDQRVFISSSMAELRAERKAAAALIRGLGAEPVWFEELGGRDDDAVRAYLSEVRSSTIYLGLIGREYGRLLPSRRSATHEEFREAEKRGLRIAVFVKDIDDRMGDEQALLDEIRTFHTTGSFSDSDDLARSIELRLRRIAAEELSPWVKLNDAVFRADTIRNDGKTIHVTGTIHDPAVLSVLESMRPAVWFGPSPSTLTYVDRSFRVRIESLSTEARTSRVTRVEVTLRIEAAPEPFIGAISFGLERYSAEDVTEAAVRHALFGESDQLMMLSFGGSLPNPLDVFPRETLSDEVLRPLVRLVLTEMLVGSGRATRLTKLRLSAPSEGLRRLVLGWIGVARAGKPAEPREVDGHLRLS